MDEIQNMERMDLEQLSQELFSNLGMNISAKVLKKRMFVDENEHHLAQDIEIYSGIAASTPFARSVFEKVWNKDSFIIADYLYPNNETIGMTPEQILTCPFMYFTHGGYIDDVESIISSGFLELTHVVTGQASRSMYPGVYCSPFMQSEYDSRIGVEREVYYVLSLALLKKRAWHINREQNFGNINTDTWDWITLPKYLRSDYTSSRTHPFGEIVFHDHISLEYVEAIIVTDPNDLEDVQLMIGETGIPVHTLQQWQARHSRKLVTSLYAEGLYTDDLPNFCYDNMGGNEFLILTPNNIRCTLLNSGFSMSEAEGIVSMRRDQLLILLKDLWMSRLRKGEKHTPLIHPPY